MVLGGTGLRHGGGPDLRSKRKKYETFLPQASIILWVMKLASRDPDMNQ